MPELDAYAGIRAEVKYGENSRIDFLLSEPGLPDAYVEVKNVHLRRDGRFGRVSRLRDRAGCQTSGRTGGDGGLGSPRGDAVSGAAHRLHPLRFGAPILTPGYGAAFDLARQAGVEVMAIGTKIAQTGVEIGDPVTRYRLKTRQRSAAV